MNVNIDVAFHCDLCGGEIYEGEEYYYLEPVGYVCTECISYAHRYDAQKLEPSN